MHTRFAPRPAALSAIALAAFVSSASSQVVLGPPRYDTTAPVGSAYAKPAANAPGSQSTLKSIFGRSGPLLTWGPLAVRPHSSYSIMQSDGLLRIPGQPLNTVQHTISQGLLLELGKTWTFDGQITRTMYDTRELEDTYTGSVTLSGQWGVGDWRFGVSQHLSTGAPLVAETGSQNDERTASTRAEAQYQAGAKTSLQGSVTWSQRKADARTANAAWTGSDWDSTNASVGFDYTITQRTRIGASLDAGYDRISNNPDMSYYSPNVRFSWRPTDRLTFSGGAGYEIRTTEGTGGRKFRNPVYNASVGYSPTLTTTVTVSASRNVTTAYFNDQTIRNESWSAGVSQRLLARLFLSGSYSEGQSAYAATIDRPGVNRGDRYRSASLNLSTGFGTRGSIGLTAQQSRNITNVAGFQFKTHTIGADISYRF